MFNTNPAMRLVHSKAKEGCAQAYEALILGMFESMKRFPGFLGADNHLNTSPSWLIFPEK